MARTALLASAAAAALVAASFTPPGRAATGWIADVAGVGDEPTVEQVGSVEGSPTVMASGVLSDGTRYEVVAKRVNADSFQPGPGAREGVPELLCFQVDWPDVQEKAGGGACTRSHRTGEGNKIVLETSGLFRAPEANEAGPALFMGIADDRRVADVAVVQARRDGTETRVPSDLLTVEGELLARLGGSYPVSVFVAPLDVDVVQAGRAREAQVSAVAYSDAGDKLGRTDAFPPLSCPADPSSLLPDIPPGPPRPVTPEEAEAFGRATECGYTPPPVTDGNLPDPAPAPPVDRP